MEASMSKLKGLTIDQQVEFERRLVKLRNARQAAIEHATAYDAALAEMRNFAGSEGRRADNYAANLGDSWQDKDRADHRPRTPCCTTSATGTTPPTVSSSLTSMRPRRSTSRFWEHSR